MRGSTKQGIFVGRNRVMSPLLWNGEFERERKYLRVRVTDLKERLLDGEVYSYSWLPTNSMWADMLTKEMEIPLSLEDVILRNILNLPQPLMNEIRALGTKIRMSNIQNR